ncbi:MAG: tetratricopeptide repeat protein [Woeseiaceae bacterium]
MASDKSDFKSRRSAVRKLDDKGAVAEFLDAAQHLVGEFPKRSAAWVELGIALTYVARYDEALSALNKSIRLRKPKYHAFPFALKGDLYRAKGNYRLAEQWYRKAIDAEPRNADWWAFLGGLLARQGRLDEAKAVWLRQIKLGTGATEEGHLNLGFIYRSEQRYKIALRHAEKALAIDPKYEEAKLLQKDLINAMNEAQ